MCKLPQTPDERERKSDRLFLEFAIKKCALTLSKSEILTLTEQVLTQAFDCKDDENRSEYERDTESREPDLSVAEDATACSAVLSDDKQAAVIPQSPLSDIPPLPKGKGERLSSWKSERARGKPQKKQKKKKSFFGDLLFYGVLIALIVGVIILTSSSGQGPRSFAGFTVQTVLTSSMESVYPKGSLVISRYTEPDTLEIGDDITFMASEDTTISHRIIGIVENYADTGQRAFQTQGVMNSAPDSELVPAVNVVGKVVFGSLTAGKIVDFIKSYWPLLLFFIVILAVLTRVLTYIYRKDGNNANGKKTPESTQKPR